MEGNTLNDHKKNLKLLVDSVSSSDYWLAVTSENGRMRLLTNSNLDMAAVLLFHAAQYIEFIHGDDPEESLLPATPH